MRVVLQRVTEARVSVAGQIVGQIGPGLCLLVGIARFDTEAEVRRLANKVADLRIFEDGQGKMNLDLAQIQGEILSISQFTLYADCRNGRRPGFDQAARPEQAKPLWELFNQVLRKRDFAVAEGIFGADMQVDIHNNGPVTIWLDSEEVKTNG